MTKLTSRRFLIVGISLILTVLVGLSSLLVLSQPAYMEYEKKQKLQLEALDRHKEAMLQDLKLLDTESPFKDVTYERNADTLISKYVPYEGAENTAASGPAQETLKSLFDRHKKWASDPQVLAQLAADPDLQVLDTSWVAELSTYDHWNSAANSIYSESFKRIAEAGGLERIGILAQLPIPKMGDLGRWTVVYALQKITKGESIEGLKALRHTARLLHSTGHLVGAMVAVVTLNQERFLTEYFKVADWTSVAEPTVLAYKRMSWAWTGLMHSLFFRELDPAWKPYLFPHTGLCSGVGEAAFGNILNLQSFLEDRFPLERPFTAGLERVRKIHLSLHQICNLSHFDVVLTPVPTSAEPLILNRKALQDLDIEGDGLLLTHLPINPSRIPYVRQMTGLTILSIGLPNWTKQYDENP